MNTFTIGTFNVNNLFSRFNFVADVADATTVVTREKTTFTFDAGAITERRYKGRLVKAKSATDRAILAQRIRAMNVDVLALQEVEDIDVLREFVRQDLGGMYPFVTLIEGNDPRLIDVAVVSRLPLGAVGSWQHAVHPSRPSELVFGRDLLEVEVLDPTRRRKLFTLFNTHLKSHYVDYTVADKEAAAKDNNARRRRQGEVIAEIIRARTRPDSPWILAGDMNDPPGARSLRPLREIGAVNALARARPVGTVKRADKSGSPGRTVWTHRFKEAGQPADYALLDQLWVGQELASRVAAAWIGRRERLGGDASDHDPAWLALAGR